MKKERKQINIKACCRCVWEYKTRGAKPCEEFRKVNYKVK